MKTEQLIHELVKESEAIERNQRPIVRFCRWFLVSLLCVTTGIAVLGLRPDLESVVWTPTFFLQAFFTLGLATLSALSAFIFSVPDKKKIWLNAVPGVTLALWLGVIGRALFSSADVRAGMGLSCVRDIVILGLFPGVFLFVMLRQAAPLKLGKVGVLAALSVAGLGAIGTQFICTNDDPLHILLWHHVPVLILGGTGVFLGRLVLKWDRL